MNSPASAWIGIEDAAASKMGIFQDIWSALLFKISQWRWGIDKENLKKWWWLLLAPLVIILGRRLYVRKKIQRIKTGTEKKMTQVFSRGRDSAFYRIEKRLHELGFERNPWETPAHWIQRIEGLAGLLVLDDILSCLQLHYQDRFGMDGLSAEEQSRLEAGVGAVLEELERGAGP